MSSKLIVTAAAVLLVTGVARAAEIDAVIDDGTRFATKAAKSPEKLYYGKIALDSKGKLVSQVNLEGRVTKATKVAMSTFDEKTKKWLPGEAIPGGVDADLIKESGKVLRVRVTVRDDKTITQILVTNTDEKLERAAGEFDAIFKGIGKRVVRGSVSFAYVRVELDEKGRVFNSFPMTITGVPQDMKIAMGKYNEQEKKWEAGDDIPNGVFGDLFKDPGAKTIYLRMTYRDDNRGIARILVRQVGDQGKK
jgi:hypothetical protein